MDVLLITRNNGDKSIYFDVSGDEIYLDNYHNAYDGKILPIAEACALTGQNVRTVVENELETQEEILASGYEDTSLRISFLKEYLMKQS